MIQRNSSSVIDFLNIVKKLINELVLIDWPLINDDITLYIMQELGSEYKEIAAPIRVRDTFLMFEELQVLFGGHETYLHWLNTSLKILLSLLILGTRRIFLLCITLFRIWKINATILAMVRILTNTPMVFAVYIQINRNLITSHDAKSSMLWVIRPNIVLNYPISTVYGC